MNDTRRLQKLIDEGKPLDPVEYLIDDYVHLRSGASVRGMGYGSSIRAVQRPWKLKANGGMGMLNADKAARVRIANLRMIGVSNQPHETTPKLIYGYQCEQTSITRCWFEDHNAEGIWGSFSDSAFSHNYFTRVGNITAGDRWYALPALQPFGDRLKLTDNTLVDCGSGIGPTGRNVLVKSNTVIGAALVGIGIGDSAHMAEGPAIVEDNYVQMSSHQKHRRLAIALPGARDAGTINVVGNRVSIETMEGHQPIRGLELGQALDAVFERNQVEWLGQSIGLEASGRSGAVVRLRTKGNRFYAKNHGGRGMVVTPSGGREIRWHGERDEVYGIAPDSIAIDCAEYRGGKVSAVIEESYIESGYFRDPSGRMTSAAHQRISNQRDTPQKQLGCDR